MGLFDWFRGKRKPPAPETHAPTFGTRSPEREPFVVGLKLPEPAPADGKPGAPRVLSGLDDDSPWVVLISGTGMTTVMDRETYEYMYGESSAPDPAQRDLDELLATVTRVRAIAGGMYRGRAMGLDVVLDTSAPEALDALRRSFQIVEDPATFNHCACLGGPTLELFAGDELAATIGLQHG